MEVQAVQPTQKPKDPVPMETVQTAEQAAQPAALVGRPAPRYPDSFQRSMLLGLQRTVGNQAVQRSLSRPQPSAQQAPPALTIQRAVDLISPASQETPMSIWNKYQAATKAVEDWQRQKRDYARFQEDSIAYQEKMKNPPSGGRTPRAPRKVDEPGPQPAEPAIPWIALKDLYAAVTITGDTSWLDLVRQRSSAAGPDNAVLFTVFTGTHGNLGGQFLDKDGNISMAYKDASHTKQDEDKVIEIEKELPQCKVRLIDIFEAGLRKPETLKATVQAEIAEGRVAILAWCYSMEGFKAVPDTITEVAKGEDPTQEEIEHVTARNDMSIASIVADVFGDDLDAYTRPPQEILEMMRQADGEKREIATNSSAASWREAWDNMAYRLVMDDYDATPGHTLTELIEQMLVLWGQVSASSLVFVKVRIQKGFVDLAAYLSKGPNLQTMKGQGLTEDQVGRIRAAAAG